MVMGRRSLKRAMQLRATTSELWTSQPRERARARYLSLLDHSRMLRLDQSEVD